MKKLPLTVLLVLFAAALFATGWHFGRSTTSAKPGLNSTEPFSEPSTISAFDSMFQDLVITYVAIQAIDAGKLEDAKQQLRVRQDSAILGVDRLWDSKHIATRRSVEKLLAGIAKHRAEHPWRYTGKLPASTDAQVEANINEILKRATANQN
jgi:hypothetical protein